MSSQHMALLFDQKRYDLAAEEARRVLASDPEDPVAHALLSLSLTNLDEFEEATWEAKAAVAAAPTLPLAHVALAAAMSERNRFSDARRAASEAIRLDPDDPDHHALLANVELMNRRWQAAYEATTRGLAIVADHAELLRARSVAAAHLGRLPEAQAASASSLRSIPDEPMALATQGYQQMHAGRFSDARATFTNTLQLDPTNQLARAGLIETIKATNPLYRVILTYFLWMSRLPRWQQFLVIFGGPAIFRSLRNAFRGNPETEWLLVPLVAVWLTIVLSTWLAGPLSNLALFLHPLGRHALGEDERFGASLIGGLVLIALLGLGAWGLGADAGLFLAVAAAATALPTAGAFQAENGWPRWTLALFAVATAVAGAAGATLAFIRPEGIADGSPAWGPFLAGIALAVISSWLAQWLTRVQPAR